MMKPVLWIKINLPDGDADSESLFDADPDPTFHPDADPDRI
jgi:hypothetical protein